MKRVKSFAKFRELSLSAIQPDGWLKNYLEKQRDGLTGHIEAAGYPFDTHGWAGKKIGARSGSKWWPYEQTAYWVDGAIRCGRILDDPFLIKKAKKQIDYVLNHADSDGYLGPQFLKAEHLEGMFRNRWSHAVFFRALMAEYSATEDRRIVKALRKHYLSDDFSYTDHRDVCNVEIMLWIYEQTGDRRILDRAVKALEGFNRRFIACDATVENMLSDEKSTEHGVTYNEIAKLGAIVYLHTGKKDFLRATVNAYRKLERDHLLIDGVNSSSERLSGKGPLESHETCDIADYTWSVGALLMATGSAEYANKIERACFNAAPGAVRSNFKALQYFSCPNQVVATRFSNHNFFCRGNEWMSYRPNPGTECCAGEVNRIMPNYVSRMWLSDGNGGLVAALYGPGRITAKVGEGNKAVTITEETDYPFSEKINFSIETSRPAHFALTLRIPGWCSKAEIRINGKRVNQKIKGGFFKIMRTFSDGDKVILILPMDLKLVHCPGGGIAIERGPLVYALKIKEDWRIDKKEKRSTKKFPAWNLFPASRWNYALCVNEKNLAKIAKIIHKPLTDDPWSLETVPIEMEIPAHPIRGWKLIRKSSVLPEYSETQKGQFVFTPPLPDPHSLRKHIVKKIETVTLVPYGATHLRITIFPQCPQHGA